MVYCAVAFAVIQAADVIFPRIPLPEWTVSAVVWLTLLGLPVALLLAWVFEITPDGVRRTDDGAAPPASARWLTARTIAAVGAALAIAVAAGWLARGARPPSSAEEELQPSIAVIPLQNRSDQPDSDYVSDGLADELLDLLSQIPGLKVAARSSAFAFKGRTGDVRVIGDSLGVRMVLGGTVRREGSLVRVAAQLVDARSGVQLWSKQFDATTDSVMVVQERIGREIVVALRMQLSDVAFTRARPKNAAAYDYYLRGLERFHRRGGTGSDVGEAIDFFEQAIAMDSGYAKAWAWLAVAEAAAPAYTTNTPEDATRATRTAAARALALDPRLAEPHAALCMVQGYFELRWAEAEDSCRRAVALNTNSATAHEGLARILLAVGKLDEAEGSIRRAIALDPYSNVTHRTAALIAGARGDDNLALQRIRAAVRLDPNNINRAVLFVTLWLVADTAGAEALISDTHTPEQAAGFKRLIRSPAKRDSLLAFLETPNPKLAPNIMRLNVRINLGNRADALRTIAEEGSRNRFNLPLGFRGFSFRVLHGDPQFNEIIRGIGLEPPVVKN